MIIVKSSAISLSTQNMILQKAKTCRRCGLTHYKLPETVRWIPQDPLYFFECSCRSTLTVKRDQVKITH